MNCNLCTISTGTAVHIVTSSVDITLLDLGPPDMADDAGPVFFNSDWFVESGRWEKKPKLEEQERTHGCRGVL